MVEIKNNEFDFKSNQGLARIESRVSSLHKLVRGILIARGIAIFLAVLYGAFLFGFYADVFSYRFWGEQLPFSMRVTVFLSALGGLGYVFYLFVYREIARVFVKSQALSWLATRRPELKSHLYVLHDLAGGTGVPPVDVHEQTSIHGQDARATMPETLKAALSTTAFADRRKCALSEVLSKVDSALEKDSARSFVNRKAVGLALLPFAITLIFTITTFAAFDDETTSVFFQRLVSDVAWPTRVTLIARARDALPDGSPANASIDAEKRSIVLASDSALTFEAFVPDESEVMPEDAFVEFDTAIEGVTSVRMLREPRADDGLRFSWTLPPASGVSKLRVRALDAFSEWFDIRLVSAPRVRKVETTVAFPESWKVATREFEGHGSEAAFVPGGVTTIKITSDQKLGSRLSAELRHRDGSKFEGVTLQRESEFVFEVALTDVRAEGNLKIAFTATTGISVSPPLRLNVSAYPDRPPEVSLTTSLLPLAGGTSNVLALTVPRLPLTAIASDDILVTGAFAYLTDAEAGEISRVLPLQDYEHRSESFESHFLADFEGLASSVLVLRATDSHPPAEMRFGESEALQIMVVSNVELERRHREIVLEARDSLRRAKAALAEIEKTLDSFSDESARVTPTRDVLLALVREQEALNRLLGTFEDRTDRVYRSMVVNRSEGSILGPSHEKSLIALNVLARTLLFRGDTREAADLEAEARRILIPAKDYTGREEEDRQNALSDGVVNRFINLVAKKDWRRLFVPERLVDPRELPTDVLREVIWRAGVEQVGLSNVTLSLFKEWYLHPAETQGTGFFRTLEHAQKLTKKIETVFRAMQAQLQAFESYELLRGRARRLRTLQDSISDDLQRLLEEELQGESLSGGD
ncbi:MAG: tetratricopeptide repeat protein [Planctomycetes bacterium]|nr:tetratricopeptide repeat protein [Planctomycetota bacterium]